MEYYLRIEDKHIYFGDEQIEQESGPVLYYGQDRGQHQDYVERSDKSIDELLRQMEYKT